MKYARVRIGLAGLGRHGLRYAQHLAAGDVEGASLSRVYRRDEATGRAHAERLGAAYAPSIEALCAADDVDCVVAAVPAGVHAALARAVAKADKPLLLEKPLARTVAEGRAIVEAFEGRPLMIAQTLRFDPLLAALAHASRDPSLGQIVGADFEQRLEPRGLPWEDDPLTSGGGVVMQTAIHTLDALRFTTGTEPRVVSARFDRVHYENQEDHAVITLRLTGGLASVRVSKIGGFRRMRYALLHSGGAVEADFMARTLTIRRGRDDAVSRVEEVPTVVATLRAFVAHLQGGPNPVPGRDALASLALVEAAYRAAERPDHAPG